ncbi:MAG: SsrA-binding protein SmpB [Woeseiaceae bacterium]|jgi:SsrA-binding protein|nr:SsrA-binding protein SmpB [Woeseiaceae bacterium]|tara:strand:+ start:1488 stop:1970 length:483 start_codon:yes stop_codon:yes gene_type:complete
MNKNQKSSKQTSQISQNKRARHDYHIQETIEAGMQLEGWEVKSLREGRSQLTEGYVNIKNGEAWLVGTHISPLNTVSTHYTPDPRRARKLLLNKFELNSLVGSVDRKGYTLIPLKLYWKRGKVKLEIGLGKGKQQHDKRHSIKEKDWSRQKARVLKNINL